MNRVITYIDGFNLYFGLRESNKKSLYWLDLVKLSESLLKPVDELINVKYFTARITMPADQARRQSAYIDALSSLSKLNIYYGKYQSNPYTCKNCNFKSFNPSEKKTDVNIAVEMMTDSFTDKCDKLILISADSDLVPVIEKIKELIPEKKIIVVFPPNRNSNELKQLGTSFHLGSSKIRSNLLPNQIILESGIIINKPIEWN